MDGLNISVPKDFKKEIDLAQHCDISEACEGVAASEDWESVLDVFRLMHYPCIGTDTGRDPSVVKGAEEVVLSTFRSLDKSFAHLKAFSRYRKNCLQTMIAGGI